MWFFFALGAAVIWGLTYTLYEQLYKHISLYSVLALVSLLVTPVFVAIAFATGSLKEDLPLLLSSHKVWFFLGLSALGLVLAEICISSSIYGKNAALAGLVEISYPFFIILFSYFLFRESSITLATAFGGALVFIGIAVIYLFNH